MRNKPWNPGLAGLLDRGLIIKVLTGRKEIQLDFKCAAVAGQTKTQFRQKLPAGDSRYMVL